MPIDRWMYKEDVVYNGILLSHKKRNNTICSNIDGPRTIVLSEISQRKMNIIQYHLYTNELIYKTEIDSQKINMVTTSKKGLGGGINWDLGLTYIHHCV